MNQKRAEAIADAFGGEAWQSGVGMWVVTLHRGDGKTIAMTDDAICLYEDDAAFDKGQAEQSIELHEGIDDGRLWVVQDAEGTVYFRNDQMEVGWRDREEAQYEAMGIESRLGIHCFAREQCEIDGLEASG